MVYVLVAAEGDAKLIIEVVVPGPFPEGPPEGVPPVNALAATHRPTQPGQGLPGHGRPKRSCLATWLLHWPAWRLARSNPEPPVAGRH